MYKHTISLIFWSDSQRNQLIETKLARQNFMLVQHIKLAQNKLDKTKNLFPSLLSCRSLQTDKHFKMYVLLWSATLLDTFIDMVTWNDGS
jgi:hypothetical protein